MCPAYRILAIGVYLVILPLLIVAEDRTYIVNSLGDAPAANPAAGTGQTATGEITLRSAMEAAEVDGVLSIIEFEPSLFQGGPAEIDLGDSLPVVSGSLIVDGPGYDLLTVRSTQSVMVIINSSPSCLLVGLTFTGSRKGAIHNVNSTLEVRDCHLHDNDGLATDLEGGGGISNVSGNLTIIGSVIGPNNTAQYSGGVDNYFGSGNQLVVINSTFVGNHAETSGGGIYNGGTNNTALLINCTLLENSAGENGGAIVQEGLSGGLTIVNGTIANNTAGQYVGGIYNIDSVNTLLINTVVANNHGALDGEVNVYGRVSPDCEHNFVSVGKYLLDMAHGQRGNQIGTESEPLIPLLAWSEENPFPILPAEGSPLIDAGTPAIPQLLVGRDVYTDALGEARLQGAAVDIGAVEVQGNAPLIPGDYNGDGVVNIKDVTDLSAHVLAGVPLPVELNPDYNGDGVVDINDPQKLIVDIANGTVGGP